MALEIVFAVLLFVGLLITCIPTLPGLPIMFLMTLAYGIFDKFQTLHPWQLAVFGGLAVFSVVIDRASGVIGAKLGGASRKALLFGIAGLFIGLIFFPPFGSFIGLFLGVFCVELFQFNDHLKALKAASYSLVATLVGAVANILIAIVFYAMFLIIVF